MKLSIIIPVYNEAKYLKRCLESVYANDDVEVIIIDDGSTDGSVDIAQRYANANHYKFIQQPNSGVSVARNLGILHATGDYVTFLDSDDYILPHGIETMLAVIANHGDPIIQFNHSRDRYDNPEGYYTLDKLPKKWVLVWNKVYLRSFLTTNDIRFPQGVIFEEDRVFNLRCFHFCNRIYNSKCRIINKCFDNSQSICHTVTKEKLLSSSNALTDLLAVEDNPKVEKIIRKCLENLWASGEANRIFGDKK